MALQGIERRLERMVDGVFSRSRNGIRPIELGRRLIREMDDQRSVDVKGRRIVPNDFTIMLSARDHTGFADIEDALRTELVEAAREYAREEGYHFIGPVTVGLSVDPNMRAGRFGIVSQLRQAPVGTVVGSLVLPSGERIDLAQRPVTIGRLTECEISLPDQNVSRRHAQVRPGSRGYVIADLGSTNGTMVNGERLTADRRLSDGDIISVGATHIRFEAS
jgi:FhaA, N-terminal domain/FHA domain